MLNKDVFYLEGGLMEEAILFIGVFLIVFLLYYFRLVRKELNKDKPKKPKKILKKRKKKKEKESNKDLPIEIEYLVVRYKIDLTKIPYKKFLYVIALVSSFDIALLVTIVSFINGFILQLLASFVLAIVLILVSFHLIGTYFKKVEKGKKKDV